MNECTVLELKEKVSRGGINLVDVREYAEFANGRVSVAKHIPLSEVGKLHKDIDVSEKVYVICQTGRRSGEAQDILKAVGYKDVTNVRGGLKAWKDAGFATEKDAEAPWEIERQVRLVAGALVLFGAVFGLLFYWGFVLISAFVGAGLMFAAITDTCTMGKLLLKMPWNQGQKPLASKQ